MTKKSDMLYITPTGLQAYCECPAKLWWMQRWELKKPKDNFGSNVHRRMEDGSEYDPAVDFKQVAAILPKLRKLEADLGYKVLGREVEQRWEILPGVTFSRRMDVIAKMPSSNLVIPDYKSCSQPWVTFPTADGLAAPKAMTLQAAGYLMPPPEGEILILKGVTLTHENWPSRAYFLMGPERGEAAWFPYDRDQRGDELAFLHVARLAVETLKLASGGVILRNRGEVCDSRRTYPSGKTFGWECDWKPVCYDLPGWKNVYRKKQRNV